LVLDTGSDWLWVNSKYCKNCGKNPSFEETISPYYKDYKTISYAGGESVRGYVINDYVCITQSVCDSSFKFLSVIESSAKLQITGSGFIGMSPYSDNEADLLIQKLKEESLVD